jgi:hypothetical protein
MTTLQGVIHGKMIELDREPGIPDGQTVVVSIQRLPPPVADSSDQLPCVELWIDRLVFDSAVLPAERVVKGTCLSAEALVAEMQDRSDEEMLRAHSELTRADIDALRHYGRVPGGLRRSIAGWADDAEELDKYLEWTRQQPRRDRGAQEGPVSATIGR